MLKPKRLFITGSQPVNLVLPVTHAKINILNHLAHQAIILNARLYMPNNEIPIRRGGTKEEKKVKNEALEKSEENFKKEVWTGPCKMGVFKPDATGR